MGQLGGPGFLQDGPCILALMATYKKPGGSILRNDPTELLESTENSSPGLIRTQGAWRRHPICQCKLMQALAILLSGPAGTHSLVTTQDISMILVLRKVPLSYRATVCGWKT